MVDGSLGLPFVTATTTSPGDARLDPAFTALPLKALADAGLSRAQQLGATHADVRVERIRSQQLRAYDGVLQHAGDGSELGVAVRVVHDGSWGFAAGVELTTEAVAALAEQAVAVAKIARPMTLEPIELADEPSRGTVTYVSAYDVNPFEVPTREKTARLVELSKGILGNGPVQHVAASLSQYQENKFYADLAGTVATQQRVRLYPHLEAHGSDPESGIFDSMATTMAPAGRGFEYVRDAALDAQVNDLPGLLAEKLTAPTVAAGDYDVVIDPTNLWLTIHESIGHATELDRALGYEANYAGTSFATPDKLNTLRYGSPVMNVTGDRTVENGLATTHIDDDGVRTTSWDLIKDGVLVGYQLDRRTAKRYGFEVSNGCAFADSPLHVPIQRMANVSLQPSSDDISTADLISRVDQGIYIVGDRSWSIDMQRYNFQFTGQRFYRIENGQLGGQVRDVAYQATTTDFWGAMEAVGGQQTYVLGGAFNCGKAEPGQVASVSHGCPSALFRGIRILNTNEESGR
jgi:TldD protein